MVMIMIFSRMKTTIIKIVQCHLTLVTQVITCCKIFDGIHAYCSSFPQA